MKRTINRGNKEKVSNRQEQEDTTSLSTIFKAKFSINSHLNLMSFTDVQFLKQVDAPISTSTSFKCWSPFPLLESSTSGFADDLSHDQLTALQESKSSNSDETRLLSWDSDLGYRPFKARSASSNNSNGIVDVTTSQSVVSAQTLTTEEYPDPDGLVISIESAKKIDQQIFLDAMTNLVLQYFKEGYIAPFLFLKYHFDHLKNTHQLNVSLCEQFFNQEINKIINDAMVDVDQTMASFLLKKLLSAGFDFGANAMLPSILQDIYFNKKYDDVQSPGEQNAVRKDELEVITPLLPRQDGEVKDESVKQIETILKLNGQNEFDEAAYRGKQYFHKYHSEHNKIFHVKVSATVEVNATLLFYSSYIALALELFEKKGHLTLVLHALSELRKLIKLEQYENVRGIVYQMGEDFHHDLMEIIKKNGLDFYEKIKIKLGSKYAKRQLEADFYVVLDYVVNNVFKPKVPQSLFDNPFSFMPQQRITVHHGLPPRPKSKPKLKSRAMMMQFESSLSIPSFSRK